MAKSYTIKQGEVFIQPVEFVYENFDFTDCEIESQLRESPTKSVVHEFEIIPDFTELGKAKFNLEMTEQETAALKIGKYKGDIKIKRTSPEYGPYIVAEYCIEVLKPYTQTDVGS